MDCYAVLPLWFRGSDAWRTSCWRQGTDHHVDDENASANRRGTHRLESHAAPGLHRPLHLRQADRVENFVTSDGTITCTYRAPENQTEDVNLNSGGTTFSYSAYNFDGVDRRAASIDGLRSHRTDPRRPLSHRLGWTWLITSH